MNENNFVNNPVGQVSQLSNALRNVNINNNNGGILESDINFELSQQQNPNNLNSNNDNGDININSNSNINAPHPEILHQEPKNEYSRITKFFQNQPMQGYTLFSHRSAPNGFKVSIVLSELKLPYQTIFLDFNKGEHRAPEFVAMNPNARVPALIDHSLDNFALWESGAILLHLVNKNWRETGTPTLWSDELTEQSQINSWLFFQTSGHAPMIGQALHFKYFHSQKIESALERYTDEVRRVYGVVEMALAERREALVMEFDTENAAAYSAGTTPLSQSKFFDYPVWLVGDKLTVADLSFVPWNNVVDRIGINIKAEFPEVYKWTKHMMRRPAVIKAFRGE
ncbi:hypothetical protein KAFR_0A07960 [Kazachstania africana CBS 2517]|uniref:Protein URE2 n=1 Tax=Kazachstania africana (strain ATCC 22294 / BCRC 22015 / CBS 2517 / CECT 1963 / NBRC 1671 / NRRL Y-8276) TaxID=1071382 RepID=H2APD0_KAZAF|nr:hypothetical protein KAFR_0A07960 [Kazachstania africana CBS 2517]CCF56230.1 hypothetical protein KAFR_0A07960 [Kazachstania africana CBS 2517]